MDLEENTWKYFFRQEKEKEYLKKLEVFVKDQYSKTTVFPAYENIFNAYRYTKPKDIKNSTLDTRNCILEIDSII